MHGFLRRGKNPVGELVHVQRVDSCTAEFVPAFAFKTLRRIARHRSFGTCNTQAASEI